MKFWEHLKVIEEALDAGEFTVRHVLGTTAVIALQDYSITLRVNLRPAGSVLVLYVLDLHVRDEARLGLKRNHELVERVLAQAVNQLLSFGGAEEQIELKLKEYCDQPDFSCWEAEG